MVGIKMKVGPKGQVVIPYQIRGETGIEPGNDVLFDIEEGTITIKKPNDDIEGFFKRISKQVKPGEKSSVHGIYEEYDQRWKRAKKYM